MTRPILLNLVQVSHQDDEGGWPDDTTGLSVPWLVAAPFHVFEPDGGAEEWAGAVVNLIGDPNDYAVKETVKQIARLVDASALEFPLGP